MSFDGASVLVTGGSRGIGKAIALRFVTLGARRVAIGYMRGDSAAEETAAELRQLGAEVTLVRGNVASQRIADEVAALGPLDVLVHAAATGVIRPALETDDKHGDWTLSANARALLTLTRAAAPAMPAGASILGISSLGSTRVLENYALVGASKAALEALVRYLAVELAPRGIRVNAVSAGVVETGALEHFPNKEAMLEMGRANPAGRIVSPEDVAGCVTFLCSPEAEMIRGQTLVIDGGWSLSTRRSPAPQLKLTASRYQKNSAATTNANTLESSAKTTGSRTPRRSTQPKKAVTAVGKPSRSVQTRTVQTESSEVCVPTATPARAPRTGGATTKATA